MLDIKPYPWFPIQTFVFFDQKKSGVSCSSFKQQRSDSHLAVEDLKTHPRY